MQCVVCQMKCVRWDIYAVIPSVMCLLSRKSLPELST